MLLDQLSEIQRDRGGEGGERWRRGMEERDSGGEREKEERDGGDREELRRSNDKAALLSGHQACGSVAMTTGRAS